MVRLDFLFSQACASLLLKKLNKNNIQRINRSFHTLLSPLCLKINLLVRNLFVLGNSSSLLANQLQLQFHRQKEQLFLLPLNQKLS